MKTSGGRQRNFCVQVAMMWKRYQPNIFALLERCRAEARCLITLGLDFGNPLIFPPADYAGIVVLRLPPKPVHDDLVACIRTLNTALAANEIDGKLWIVQRGRVRVYQDPHAEK